MVVDVAWSPNGKHIVSSSTDGVMHIWEAETGKNIRTITLTKPKPDVEVPQSAIAWSPDGQRIASGDSNGSVQIWDANTGNRLLLFEGHTGAVTSIMWSPDGKFVLSAGDDHTVRIWQLPHTANW
jgi:WD40 repeat protein